MRLQKRKGQDTEVALREVIRLIGGMENIVKKGGLTVIKPYVLTERDSNATFCFGRHFWRGSFYLLQKTQ